MKFIVKVECEVPSNFFERGHLNSRIEGTLRRQEAKLEERYQEIMNFLREHNQENHNMLSFTHIKELFKGYVCKALLNESVDYTLNRAENYNIMENLMSFITDAKIEEYIMGEPLIKAFENAIRSIPNETGWDATLHGSKILLLEKVFLGKNYF